MSAHDRLALPTLKLPREELLRAAREADARARAVEAAGAASTRRPEPPVDDGEIEVAVEPLDDKLDLEALIGDMSETSPPGAPKSDHSDIRPALRNEDALSLTSVPCVVVSKEDLSWFELEPASEVVLSKIDGVSSVEAIMAGLEMPRDQALAILRELCSHGVVELGDDR